MLLLWFVFNMLSSSLLMLRMLRQMLIQMSMRSTRTDFAIAVAYRHATDNVLALSPLGGAL